MTLNIGLVLAAVVCLTYAELPSQHHVKPVNLDLHVKSIGNSPIQSAEASFKSSPFQGLHSEFNNGINFKTSEKYIFELPILGYKYSNPVIRSQSFSVVNTLGGNRIRSGGSKFVLTPNKSFYEAPKHSQSFSLVNTFEGNRIRSGGSKTVIIPSKTFYEAPKRSQSFSVVNILGRNRIRSGGSKVVITPNENFYEVPKLVKQKYPDTIIKEERSQSFKTVQSLYPVPKIQQRSNFEYELTKPLVIAPLKSIQVSATPEYIPYGVPL